MVVFDAADLDGERTFWAGMLGGRVLGDEQFHCVFDSDDRWVIGVQLAPGHTLRNGLMGTHSRSTSISTSRIRRKLTVTRSHSERCCCKELPT